MSDDSIDRKIKKLEEMGLITGGRGRDRYYSAVTTAQPRTEQASLFGFAGNADDPGPASVRKSPATESFLDALKAAKLQLLNRSKPPAA